MKVHDYLYFIKNYLLNNISTKQILLKNGFWVSVASLFINGSKFTIQLYVARLLGVAEFGAYNFVISFAAFFQVLAAFGIPTLMVREVIKKRKHAKDVRMLFHNALVLKLILALISFIAMLFISLIFMKNSIYFILIPLAGIFTITQTFNEFLIAFSNGYEKMELEALSNVLEGIIFLVIMIPCILIYQNLIQIFIGFIIVSVTTFLCNLYIFRFYVLKEKIFVKIRPQLGKIESLFHDGKYLALAGFTFIMYNSSDQVLIHLFHGNNDTGIYSAAYHIIFIYFVLSSIIRKTTAPFLARNTIYANFEKLRTCAVIIGLLVFMSTYFGSGIFISVFFGQKYVPSIILVKMLSFVLIPIFYNALSANLLVMKGLQRQFSIFLIIGLCFNFFINIIFIPKYSYFAAALSTVAAESLIAILIHLYIKRNTSKIFHV